MAGWLRVDLTAILFRSVSEDSTASFDLYPSFSVRNGWVMAAPLLVAVLVAEKEARAVRFSDVIIVGSGLWVVIRIFVDLAAQKSVLPRSSAAFWIGPSPGLSSALPYVSRAACALLLLATLISRGSELGRAKLLSLGPLAIVVGSFMLHAIARVLRQDDWNWSSEGSLWLPVMVLGLGTLILTAAIGWGRWSKALLVGVSLLGCLGFVALF
jgi:hypothetical protein